ncbi:MAG TPA: sigma-70 family RNA polymerase sigma factor [Pirellulaceae bacterium]|nr:sigma-70 family RNA polymerase sigma factor [Pirellulaceae bacterium]
MVSTPSSLLCRLHARDDVISWTRFVTLYSPLIFLWVRKLGIERQSAEDLVQNVLLVVLNHASILARQPPRSFRAWLRTVTLNQTRDWMRRQKKVSNPQLILAQIEAAVEDPNLLATETEYRSYLATTALKLMKEAFSETTWRACWEHVVLGRKAEDVARELGISPNAVYLARGRVLNRLREELAGLWED